MQKLSINAGFTCPNRDGTSGVGGCSFCNGLAFNPAYCNNKTSITQQIDDGITFHKNRSHKNNSNTKYLAYFQTFSNTYQHIDNLKKIYSEALSHPDITGIIIATRPDCIDNEKLDYLQQLSESYFVKIEYGIESTYNSTLQKINRGHDFETTATAFEKTAKRKLDNNDIAGYVIIPPNYIHNVFILKNDPAIYVTKRSSSGFNVAVSNKLTKTVSDIVTNSQALIQAVFDIDKELERPEIYDVNEKIKILGNNSW